MHIVNVAMMSSVWPILVNNKRKLKRTVSLVWRPASHCKLNDLALVKSQRIKVLNSEWQTEVKRRTSNQSWNDSRTLSSYDSNLYAVYEWELLIKKKKGRKKRKGGNRQQNPQTLQASSSPSLKLPLADFWPHTPSCGVSRNTMLWIWKTETFYYFIFTLDPCNSTVMLRMRKHIHSDTWQTQRIVKIKKATEPLL